MPILGRGSDFPRAVVAARRWLAVGLPTADASEQQTLAAGRVGIDCSIPVSFPSLYWISALWVMAVAF